MCTYTYVCVLWYTILHIHFILSNKDRSLHTVHNTVLRVVDRAARSQGLSTALELSSFSSRSELPSEKRPDLTTTNWPVGNSLKVIDLATTNPVSDSVQYSSTPNSLDPERLLKKRNVIYRKLQSTVLSLSPKVASLSLWLQEHLEVSQSQQRNYSK